MIHNDLKESLVPLENKFFDHICFKQCSYLFNISPTAINSIEFAKFDLWHIVICCSIKEIETIYFMHFANIKCNSSLIIANAHNIKMKMWADWN